MCSCAVCYSCAAIMASFSVKSFERKLKEMSSRQDSVQTVSLWLIHHRAHSKIVVSLWQDHVKKAKPERRLVLFYLANDVIQNSRKKGKEFSSSFGKVLHDAMPYLRDSKIRPSVERVLKIWQERKVFDKELVQKLIAQLYRASKSESKPEAKLEEKENKNAKPVKKEPAKPKRPVPADFKVSKVVGAMVTMQEFEAETQRRETLVSQTRLDASSSDGIKQLKDRAGGNRFSMDFEESSSKMEELVQSLENENQHRHMLINVLEDSDAYYDAALKEATIIANAYHSFGNRLHTMKKKLDNKIRKFATAEKEAPVSAPKASFLSSGLSGILEEVNKSPSGSSDQSKETEKKIEEMGEAEEKGKEKEEKEEKVIDPTVDHVEVADMDIESDSENEGEASDSVAQLQQSDTTSNTDGSGVSTPVPATTDDATKSTNVIPVVDKPPSSTSSNQQFGYTMTVNSTEETGTDSPASHDSAPSPEGSPDLNLDQYDEPATKMVNSGDTDVTKKESFLARPQSNVGTPTIAVETVLQANSEEAADKNEPGKESNSKPPNTVHLIAQLISKTRQHYGDPLGDSDESASQNASPVKSENNGGDKPLLTLIDSLFPVLSTSLRTIHGTLKEDKKEQQGTTQDKLSKDKREQSMDKDVITPSENSPIVDKRRTNREPGSGDFDDVVPNVSISPGGPRSHALACSPVSRHVPGQTGPNDPAVLEGDNTPEHGSEIADVGEAGPIIIRSGTSYTDHPEFHRHPDPIPPHTRIFDRHAAMDDRQFVPRNERMHSPPREFLRSEVRRNSADEALLDERYVRNMRPPGIRSPGMVPPMDGERWRPAIRFGLHDRNDVIHENKLLERRDLYLERPNEFHLRERREMFHRSEEFHPLERRDEFARMERPGNTRLFDQREELVSIDRGERQAPEVGERTVDVRLIKVRKEFPAENREGELRVTGEEGRKDFPPKDRPDGEFPLEEKQGSFREDQEDFPSVTARTPDGPQAFVDSQEFSNMKRLDDGRISEAGEKLAPVERADNLRSIEGRKEVPPMGRHSPQVAREIFEHHQEFSSIKRPGEHRPMDVLTPEFHPAEREEGFHPLERRDGFWNVRPVGRGGRNHIGPQRAFHRPGMYRGPPRAPFRGDPVIRGFRPRFPHPPVYRRGAPMRLKRPGPPYRADAPKRPHF